EPQRTPSTSDTGPQLVASGRSPRLSPQPGWFSWRSQSGLTERRGPIDECAAGGAGAPAVAPVRSAGEMPGGRFHSVHRRPSPFLGGAFGAFADDAERAIDGAERAPRISPGD